MNDGTSVLLRLASSASAARTARRAVAQACASVPPLVRADAELLTSELVTNAVAHAGHGVVTVAIECDGRSVGVAVSDGSPEPPVSRQPTVDDTRGRGVLLVESLATAWGTRAQRSGGKIVWFRLAYA